MTFIHNKIGATLVGGLLVSFGVVQAQVAEGSSLIDGGPAQTEASATTDAAAPRPVQTILAESRATQDRIEAAADNIARQLRDAREEKDVVKTLCLDDKLNQMNVAARSVADRVGSIEAAVNANNAERVQHDDAVLQALAQRADELITEANQCIGEESGVLGQTKLELTVDPSIPKTDTAAPPPITVISSPPVAASPTL